MLAACTVPVWRGCCPGCPLIWCVRTKTVHLVLRSAMVPSLGTFPGTFVLAIKMWFEDMSALLNKREPGKATSTEPPSAMYLSLLAHTLALLWATLVALCWAWLLDNSLQEQLHGDRVNKTAADLTSATLLSSPVLSGICNLQCPAWLMAPQSMCHLWMGWGYCNTSVASSSTALMLFQSLWKEKNPHKHKRKLAT